MRSTSHRTNVVKTIVLLSAITIAIAGFAGFSGFYRKAGASVAGPSPSHTNAPGEANCTACHTDFPPNSGTGNVLISGIPANYLPGQQVPVTVTVNQMDGVRFGFQLTAVDSLGRRAGDLTFPTMEPQPLQVVFGQVGPNKRHYIEHTIDGVTPTMFGTKSWTFTWTAPAARVGKIGFYAAGNAANSDGSPSGDFIYTTSNASFSGTAISNFDPDSKSDVAVFRPSTGTWFILNSSDGTPQTFTWGAATDKITPGDYDGDGKADIAVWRPSSGEWFILRSSDGGFETRIWGVATDKPVQGDFDGDIKTDIAVWRPSTGVWHILRSSDGGYDAKTWGVATDIPTLGDFDADAKTDIAVWRPSTGEWHISRSSDGAYAAFTWGASGDIPVHGDYDTDGITDIAVFRPADGSWHVLRSTEGYLTTTWGSSTDKAVPADYDGDGRTDIAVFRPSTGAWFILRSSDGGNDTFTWGGDGDIPVPSAYFSE